MPIMNGGTAGEALVSSMDMETGGKTGVWAESKWEGRGRQSNSED